MKDFNKLKKMLDDAQAKVIIAKANIHPEKAPLEKALNELIEEEDYEVAAIIRDEIKSRTKSQR